MIEENNVIFTSVFEWNEIQTYPASVYQAPPLDTALGQILFHEESCLRVCRDDDAMYFVNTFPYSSVLVERELS